jgi:hypothetical protein
MMKYTAIVIAVFASMMVGSALSDQFISEFKGAYSEDITISDSDVYVDGPGVQSVLGGVVGALIIADEETGSSENFMFAIHVSVDGVPSGSYDVYSMNVHGVKFNELTSLVNDVMSSGY